MKPMGSDGNLYDHAWWRLRLATLWVAITMLELPTNLLHCSRLTLNLFSLEELSWQAAAQVTRETLAAHGVIADVVVTDLLTGLEKRLAGSVDVLLFNPPYVPTPENEVNHHILSQLQPLQVFVTFRVSQKQGARMIVLRRICARPAVVAKVGSWYKPRRVVAVRCCYAWWFH